MMDNLKKICFFYGGAGCVVTSQLVRACMNGSYTCFVRGVRTVRLSTTYE